MPLHKHRHYIFSGVLYFSGREAGIVMAFADSQLSCLESSTLLLLPGLPVCPSHREILWKKVEYQVCIRINVYKDLSIVWGIIVLCFLNFKHLTLHLINIHSIFLLLHFVVMGSSWLAIQYCEQSLRNPEIIGKYINLFQISLYLSLVLEANKFKADLQIVSAC